MKRKTNFIVVLCFLVSIVSQFTTNAQTKSDIKQMPDLELKMHNGETIKLSQLKGKVVLLDFWYRGCAPCLKSIRGLIELQEEFKEDLVIIGVNPVDTREDVLDYFNYKKTNYLSTYKTDNNLSVIFNIEAYPTIILYDREGKMVKKEVGYREGGIKSLQKAVKKVLK